MQKRFEAKFFEYFKNLERKVSLKPLMLGGRSYSGGGTGGPPGGFYGVLPQTRVAYDWTEEATLDTPASGESILDNLNHIRYDIVNIEDTLSGWSPISIEEDDVLVASGVTILNFEGDVNILDVGNGQATITISGGVNWNKTVIVDLAGGGDYISIKNACDYVATQVDADTSNQWLILVMPGLYEEDPFTIPQNTGVVSIEKGFGTYGEGNPVR